MGKKLIDVLEKMKSKFIEGAVKKDILKINLKKYGRTGLLLRNMLSTNHTQLVMHGLHIKQPT